MRKVPSNLLVNLNVAFNFIVSIGTVVIVSIKLFSCYITVECVVKTSIALLKGSSCHNYHMIPGNVIDNKL